MPTLSPAFRRALLALVAVPLLFGGARPCLLAFGLTSGTPVSQAMAASLATPATVPGPGAMKADHSCCRPGGGGVTDAPGSRGAGEEPGGPGIPRCCESFGLAPGEELKLGVSETPQAMDAPAAVGPESTPAPAPGFTRIERSRDPVHAPPGASTFPHRGRAPPLG